MLGDLIQLKRLPKPSDGTIFLRYPRYRDFEKWSEARSKSRNFLAKWEPRWAQDELTRHAWRRRVQHARRERRTGNGHNFLIFGSSDSDVMGGISISNVRFGVSRSGQIGYWMNVEHAGKGIMSRALKLIVSFGFEELQLHRIEAACIPDNDRSKRLLENAGFNREGLLKSYLRIDGRWQDHYLYALINE